MGALEIGVTIYFTISAALLAFTLDADGVSYLLSEWRWQDRLTRTTGKPRSDLFIITVSMIVGFLIGPIMLLAALILPERD